jgi:hypothetical protein
MPTDNVGNGVLPNGLLSEMPYIISQMKSAGTWMIAAKHKTHSSAVSVK